MARDPLFRDRGELAPLRRVDNPEAMVALVGHQKQAAGTRLAGRYLVHNGHCIEEQHRETEARGAGGKQRKPAVAETRQPPRSGARAGSPGTGGARSRALGWLNAGQSGLIRTSAVQHKRTIDRTVGEVNSNAAADGLSRCCPGARGASLRGLYCHFCSQLIAPLQLPTPTREKYRPEPAVIVSV